jgi:hypothetical protein
LARLDSKVISGITRCRGDKLKIQLAEIAHARSGDKGDTGNVGVIALRESYYPLLVKYLTVERVKLHFSGICLGKIERYELPNLGALNFLLHQSLGGGGTRSLKNDAQGKTLSSVMLRMELDITESISL